jgi:hypothetical protein
MDVLGVFDTFFEPRLNVSSVTFISHLKGLIFMEIGEENRARMAS